MTARETDRFRYLQTLLEHLEDARTHLEFSLKHSQAVLGKSELTATDLEILEALTARFARLADLLFRKVLRLLAELELYEPASLLDVLKVAAKQGIVSSETDVRQIRELRNEIAHEYAFRDIREVVRETVGLAPILILTSVRAEEHATELERRLRE